MIASGSWGLAAFPLGAAVVATVFAWRLGARFARRHRAVEGHWTVALAMFAVASAAMFLGVARGWTAAEFRLYWLFGAVLNVPYLFLGELQLLIRRRVVSIVPRAKTTMLLLPSGCGCLRGMSTVAPVRSMARTPMTRTQPSGCV